MEFKELYEKVRSQNFKMKRALGNTAAPGAMIEQTKNILYNNIDEIEAALKYAAEAASTIQVLELELNDAERELDEIKKPAAKTSRKKTASAEANE